MESRGYLSTARNLIIISILMGILSMISYGLIYSSSESSLTILLTQLYPYISGLGGLLLNFALLFLVLYFLSKEVL
ncbi:MAG: hypothetical protein WCP89_04095 [archaeon]